MAKVWIFALVTSLALARDISVEEWCGEVGGYYISPEMSLIKTGPGECHCLEKLGGIHRRAVAGIRCSAITEERLCTNPAKYICQSSEADQSAKTHDNYFAAVEAAKKSPRVQELVKKWTWKKHKAAMEGRLNELDPTEAKALTFFMNQELDLHFYGKNNRGKRVQKEFERAKQAMLAYLTARQERFPDQKVAIEGMIETVRRATYVIGWVGTTPDGLIPHNMAAQTDRSDANTPNKVLIGTVIAELDTAPEGLYFGLLHELGHFIDPRMIPDSPKHPFHLELACLRNPASMGAKRAEGLARDQINESFADWLALQAWLKEHPKLSPATTRSKYKKPVQSVYEKNPVEVEALNTWNAKGDTLRQLREINAVVCSAYRYHERVKDVTRENNTDEHPLGIDRASAMLSAPAIMRALGCPEKYIFTMKSPNDNYFSKDITAYCGEELHLPRADSPHKIDRLPPVEPSQRQHQPR